MKHLWNLQRTVFVNGLSSLMIVCWESLSFRNLLGNGDWSGHFVKCGSGDWVPFDVCELRVRLRVVVSGS